MVLNIQRNHKAYFGRGEGGRGYGGGRRARLYTYRYTVTTRMTPALRWAAMRAVFMFHNCEGQSHKTMSTDHNFWSERRPEADSNRGPSAYQPNALPLDQTVSRIIPTDGGLRPWLTPAQPAVLCLNRSTKVVQGGGGFTELVSREQTDYEGRSGVHGTQNKERR